MTREEFEDLLDTAILEGIERGKKGLGTLTGPARAAVLAAAPAAAQPPPDLARRVEAIAADCELKGSHPPLDPDSEAEADTRYAYADVARHLRAALAGAAQPREPDPWQPMIAALLAARDHWIQRSDDTMLLLGNALLRLPPDLLPAPAPLAGAAQPQAEEALRGELGECSGHLGPPGNTATPHAKGPTCSFWKPLRARPSEAPAPEREP
jgi:hypothetical protein